MILRTANQFFGPFLRFRNWFGLIGIVLIVLAEGAFYIFRSAPLIGIILALIGGIAILLANDDLNFPKAESVSSESRLTFNPSMLFSLIDGVGLIIFTGWLAPRPDIPSVWLLLSLWIVGIVLILFGVGSGKEIRAWIAARWAHVRSALGEWLLVIALTLIALVIRTVNLETFPLVMHDDEGYFAYPAAQHYVPSSFNDYYLNMTTPRPDWNWNPFGYEGVQHIPILFDVPQAVSIAIFGRNAAAARLPAAIFGALAIPGVYLLGRRLFDRRIAVIAAMFLLAFPVHVHFSRLALSQTMDPMFAAWLFAFLIEGLRTGNRVELGLAGVMLGLSQYGATPARLLPILMIVYLVWASRRRSRPILLAIPLLVALGVVFPQLYTLFVGQVEVVSRLSEIGFWDNVRGGLPTYASVIQFWFGQAERAFLGYVQLSDAWGLYGHFDPFMGWLGAIPALIGGFYALRRLPDHRYFLLVAWVLLTTILGGVLITEPPGFHRYLIAAPALAILVALGITYLGETLGITLPNPRAARWAMPLAVSVFLALFNLKTYFVDYQQARPYFDYGVPDDNLISSQFYNLDAYASDVLPRLTGYTVYTISGSELNVSTSPVLRYLRPDILEWEVDSPEALGRIATQIPGKLAFVFTVAAPNMKDAVAVMSKIPGLTSWVYQSKYSGNPLVIVYFRDKLP